MSSFFPTNGVADCYNGNHQGKNHHELREHLKVTHDSVPLSPLLRGVRGRRKAKRHLIPNMPWSRFTSPMVLFYHSGIFLSIGSDDFTVCLFGWTSLFRPCGKQSHSASPSEIVPPEGSRCDVPPAPLRHSPTAKPPPREEYPPRAAAFSLMRRVFRAVLFSRCGE